MAYGEGRGRHTWLGEVPIADPTGQTEANPWSVKKNMHNKSDNGRQGKEGIVRFAWSACTR